MEKLIVSDFLDEIIETKWRVESYGSLHIVINPSVPKTHNEFFYWRLDDPHGYYLLNIDISEDGYIKMIEVITYNRRITSMSKQNQKSFKNSRKGFIKVDTSLWVERKKEWITKRESFIKSDNPHSSVNYEFIDNPEQFYLQIDPSNLRIEILKSNITQVIWISDGLSLELNELNEICGIFLKDFMGQDRERLIRKFGKNF